MTIQEAVKKAIVIHGYITVPEAYGDMRIWPTRTHCNFIVDGFNAKQHPQYGEYGWMPTANDLMRDDWLVIEENLLPSQ